MSRQPIIMPTPTPPNMTLKQYAAVGIVLLSMTTPGCSPTKSVNPFFDLSAGRARDELKAMRREPVSLQRPVVVIGGWGDVMGVAPAYIAEQLKRATGDDRIIDVPGGVGVTFDDCRRLVLVRVSEAFPSDDPTQTIEVDVIGFSMGGVTARYAASNPTTVPETVKKIGEPTPRLRIARLYTIGTPHRGARLSETSKPIDPLSRDLHPESDFIRTLNEQRVDETYPIIAYARLNDKTVGDANTAPPGGTPYWIAPEPFSRSHGGAYHDPRLIADIARRLRGETPYTTEPAAPLPQ